MVGQYLVPFVCLVGAGVSAWRRRSRVGLLDGVSARRAGNGVADMSWQDFERLVGKAFRRQDFRVVERGGNGVDGGVDLVLRKDAERFLVQCKHWRAYTVGVQPVRELYGVMASNNASGGFFVTSGTFTDEAIRFAHGLNLELIDGVRLRRLIAEVSTRTPTGPVDRPPAQSLPQEAHGSVECPVCRGAMVRRTAKRGPSAGRAFWGCGGYPACRGTRPFD
jgi:restriction system protein